MLSFKRKLCPILQPLETLSMTQDHMRLHMLAHKTEQEKTVTVAGALSSTSCQAWMLGAEHPTYTAHGLQLTAAHAVTGSLHAPCQVDLACSH